MKGAGFDSLLAHIIAGYHTETDSWFKRHKKGYLFTIGDEPNLRNISGHALEDFLGYQHPANPISADEAVKKAQEQYNVYHIHVTNGPIPSTKPVREVNDPNNKFNEFQKTLRAVEFDVNLFQHSLLVDSTFIPHHYTHRRVLVITHRDEITSQFNDELLSGDWEEQFNSIRTSYYDKLTV